MQAIRRHSIPIVCHLGVIPSACSLGVVTPSAYSMNIMIASTNLNKPQPNVVTTSNYHYSTTTKLNHLSDGDLSIFEKNSDRAITGEEPSSRYETVKKAARGRRLSDNVFEMIELRKDMKERRRLSVQGKTDYDGSKSFKNGKICAKTSRSFPGKTSSPQLTRYGIIKYEFFNIALTM